MSGATKPSFPHPAGCPVQDTLRAVRELRLDAIRGRPIDPDWVARVTDSVLEIFGRAHLRVVR